MKKTVILIFSLIIFVLISYLIIFYIALSKIYNKMDSKDIIKIYNKNTSLFEEASKELYLENDIVLKKERNNVKILIYIEKDDKTYSIEKVEEKYFYKYKKTLYIMEKLNINYISKSENNILFAITDFGQYIIKIKDEEQLRKTYNVIDLIKIENEWFYMRRKT